MPDDWQKRRRSDPRPDDSMFRRVAKNPLTDKVIYAVVTVLIGGSASLATHQVADANGIASQEKNRAEIIKLEADLKELREKMYERVGREEDAREKGGREPQDRLIVVETRLRMR